MNDRENRSLGSPAEKVDIIIPFHLINDYLKAAIVSSLQSRDVDSNIILVDDSGDDYPIWLNQLLDNPRIVVIKNIAKGYIGALSTGVNATRAKYVGFLDSDDIMDANRISSQIEFMKANYLDICSSQILRVDSDGNLLRSKGLLGSHFDSLPPKVRLLFGAYGADSSMLLRGEVIRNTWSDHSSFPPELSDYGYLLGLVNEIKYGYCADALYLYRNHDLQMSRAKFSIDSWELVHNRWQGLLSSLNHELPRASKISLSPKVGASISFPSVLPRLSRKEIRELNIFTQALLGDIKENYSVPSKDIKAIMFRLLIASRGRIFSTWRYVPLLFLRICVQFSSRLKPRANSFVSSRKGAATDA
jgi:glycosyltransferase involved in cell wall biosynthesis